MIFDSGCGAVLVLSAADFWEKGIDKWGAFMVYYTLFYAREERE